MDICSCVQGNKFRVIHVTWSIRSNSTLFESQPIFFLRDTEDTSARLCTFIASCLFAVLYIIGYLAIKGCFSCCSCKTAWKWLKFFTMHFLGYLQCLRKILEFFKCVVTSVRIFCFWESRSRPVIGNTVKVVKNNLSVTRSIIFLFTQNLLEYSKKIP